MVNGYLLYYLMLNLQTVDTLYGNNNVVIIERGHFVRWKKTIEHLLWTLSSIRCTDDNNLVSIYSLDDDDCHYFDQDFD